MHFYIIYLQLVHRPKKKHTHTKNIYGNHRQLLTLTYCQQIVSSKRENYRKKRRNLNGIPAIQTMTSLWFFLYRVVREEIWVS